MLAASSVLAASYLRFSYTPPPGTSQRAGVSARFSERSEVGCVFNSLQRWVRDKSPRVSGERWPHVVAYCSDSLSLVCWLVEHSCAAPLPSTHTYSVTQAHRHTQTHTHTHYTLECRWSNIGVEFDIDIRNGRTNWARWGYWCEGGTTPTTGTVEPTGRGRRKVPGGKEQIPLGAAGMWRAASSRESFKG